MNATQSIIDKLLPEHLKSVSNEQDWVKARIMISFCAIAFVALLLPLTVQLLDPVQRERSAFMIMTECAILLVLTVKWHRINFRACISVVLFASLLTISAFYVYGQFSMFSTAGVYGDVLLVAAVFLVSLRFAFVLSLISLGILFWLRSKYLGGFFPLIEPDPERYWRALIVDSAASHALTLALCGMSL